MAAVLLVAAVPATAARDQVADLLLLQAIEARVATIGHRLAVSAGDLCGTQAALSGIQVHDASQYAKSAGGDLRQAFGAGPWPKVLAVAEGSAAAKAGLRANDSILSIDGQAIPEAKKFGNYARVAATLALLDQGLSDGRVSLAVARSGAPSQVEIVADRGCASRFQVKISTGMQGKADGDYVEVTTGLIAFAGDDAELAAGIAHEMAHNILRHRARLDAAGISRGILQNFGRNARLTRETEVEADRLSVYLLDRAGYPTSAAVAFWDRFRAAIFTFGDNTHPGGKERVAILKAEIARIDAAKAAGKVPAFEPNPPS
jgi:hypothetical protein